ncbi:TonB-dependent receptor [Granulicella sp. 5B5]|uniref:TonB-dependent receptor n=1 Tax=Granulicella sp. 5B5 TaxID=1617967 RepID=UPI001C711593|nr:TonB-dependent receptor [Granulicella sp. 5B5]
MKKVLAVLTLLAVATLSYGQSVTAGDVEGTVTDATGAVIPGATVTIKNLATGASKAATSNSSGNYHVSLLTPGTYQVTGAAAGFATVVSNVTVAAGVVTQDAIKLSVGQQGTTIEVTSNPEIVNTTNADIVTTFTAEQIQAMPNPGNDLTFVAQTAPGTVMNTGTAAGGYGNFSSFGISGLSNMFTLDGGYENDPFLNLNNTGASNLTLGNNEVDTVTIVAPAYSAQFGGLGGAQVNEITAAGTNRFHGNASYYWDGRALNSNDWFNKQNEAFYGEQNIPVFVNANQWGASIGGPIWKDKLFFFVNTEGIRATTPATGQVFVPNALYQACSLGDAGSCATLNANASANCENNPNTTGVGNDPNCAASDGISFAPAPVSEQPLLKTIYGVYNNSPFRPAASAISQDANDVAEDTYYAKNASLLTEWLLTARVDWKISDKDSFYIHYKQDHGLQPTYTDLIDPRFSTQSAQPAWEGQINEVHTFTPNLTNQLVLTGNYYSAPFQNSNNFSGIAPSTLLFESGDAANYGTNYGGENYAFPQGRRVSGYQVIDDVNYTRGRNTLRFGYNIRRDNITDLQGEETISPADELTEEGLSSGVIDVEHIERFPLRAEQPVSVYDMGAYIEDSYKLTPKLTVTAGLRVERNSNPTCHANCFQVLALSTSALPTGATSAGVPYNAAYPNGLISADRYRALKSFQKAGIMPRFSANWQADSKTVVRAGFGMFTDSFPGVVADDLLSNPPTNFHAAVLGTVEGAATSGYITPSTTGSAHQTAVNSDTAFESQFSTGGTYTTTAAAVANAGGHYSAPNFTTIAGSISYPTYEEWSLAVEHRIDNKSSVTISYVGNHGYHEPVNDGTRNLSNTAASASFFPTVPTAKPVTPFATISNVYSGADSNFNGVVVTGTRRSHGLTVNINYEFSKALDEISNGGFEAFAPDAGDSAAVQNSAALRQQYGPADYNVKHNTTASFVYEVPSFSERFRDLTGGFEFSGAIFHQSGLPYTVTQNTSSFPKSVNGVAAGAFANGTALLFANEISNSFDHHCGGGSHALLPDGSVPSPCDFKSAFTSPTDYGQQGRNSLVGPSYTNVDFGAFKTFHVPHADFMKLKLGAQFFNLFNHPNFQNPTHVLTSSNALGSIQSTVGAPTSILGSVGGADASPRLIQLHAGFTF